MAVPLERKRGAADAALCKHGELALGAACPTLSGPKIEQSCLPQVTEDDDATALKCTQHGIPNYRATLWEVHMLFVAVCLVNGVLAYVDFFAKKERVGFNAAFAAAPVAEPQGETELAEVDQA